MNEWVRLSGNGGNGAACSAVAAGCARQHTRRWNSGTPRASAWGRAQPRAGAGVDAMVSPSRIRVEQLDRRSGRAGCWPLRRFGARTVPRWRRGPWRRVAVFREVAWRRVAPRCIMRGGKGRRAVCWSVWSSRAVSSQGTLRTARGAGARWSDARCCALRLLLQPAIGAVLQRPWCSVSRLPRLPGPAQPYFE